MSKYDKAIKDLNKSLKDRGIILTEVGEGWKKYKEKIKKYIQKKKQLSYQFIIGKTKNTQETRATIVWRLWKV